MTYSTRLHREIEQKKQLELEIQRREILQRCIVQLKDYFSSLHVASLYLTGSIIEPHRFMSRSDIDIAVEGLDQEVYFRAIFELGELLQRDVEIIELENCSFAEKIRSTGLKLI